MAKLRLTHFFRAEYRLAKFSAGNTADLVLKFFTSGKFRVGAAALYWLDASYNKLKNFFTKMHYLCIKFRQILGGKAVTFAQTTPSTLTLPPLFSNFGFTTKLLMARAGNTIGFQKKFKIFGF